MSAARQSSRLNRSTAPRLNLSTARGFLSLLWFSVLVLLATSTLAETRVSPARHDFPGLRLSPALQTQTVLISADTTQLIDGENELAELEILTSEGSWHLSLRKHQLLGDTDTLQRALRDIPLFFQGIITGDRGSWVRLSQTTNNGVHGYEGFIERGGQLYRLQPSRLNDVDSRTQSQRQRQRQTEPSSHQLIQLGDRDVLFQDSWQPRANIAQAVTRAARIGIAVDSRFNDYHGGRGLAQALTIINGVDGLYQSQFGLALIVDHIRVYDDPTSDPIRHQTGGVEELLSAFRAVRLIDAELPTGLALVHLFSGHQDPERVIGLGWIDTACRNDGYDLSMSTPFPFDMLLAAHEIAHNLGALHDDDAECQLLGEAFESNIMWSQLSGLTGSEFSSCSLQRVLPTLEKSCILENIDVNVSLSSQQISSALERRIDVQVSNPDLTRSATGMRSETRFPENTVLSDASAACTISGTSLSCRHGALDAGEQDVVSVLAMLASFDDQQVVTQLLSDNFVDANDADNRAALNVLQMTGSANAERPSEDDTVDAAVSGNTSAGGNAGIGGSGLWLLSALGLFRLRRSGKQTLSSTNSQCRTI